jgi:ABC transport system ATP-binding/permease protein
MNFFQAEKLSKAYGPKVLFDDITFSIDQGQKTAFIARNGTGKTSLLNIIAGLDTADSGKCSYKNDIKIAYLPQDPSFNPELSIINALLDSDDEIAQTVLKYESLIEKANKGFNDEALLNDIQRISGEMDDLNAWDFEATLKQLISKLKLGDINRKAGELSGGQTKRLALAKVLMKQADFIILDEPTNHLDIDMIEWLEDYLSKKKLTLLIVSHDRYFIDNVCNDIIELENGNLYRYSGNYTYFLEKKLERQAAEASQTDKARNLLSKETEWMRKSPQARTTKSKARIRAFYDLEEKATTNNEDNPNEIMMQTTRLGKKILEVKNISKSFDDENIIKDFSYVFSRYEKIGIIGPNGTGKSTFLNIITQALKPDSGSVVTGETIKFGYYRQEGLNVNEGKKVIDVIKDIAEIIPVGKNKTFTASQFLYYFNFPYDKQNDIVRKLSGGEKRRLYLISILMANPNFLILDEPTNDLDINTLNVLEDFLSSFPGCLIVVSHDRYFLDKVVDNVFVFNYDIPVKNFPGNYSEYIIRKGELEALEKQADKTQRKEKIEKSSGDKGKTKLTFKEQKEFESLEKEIPFLENEKKILVEKMNSGNLNHEELQSASDAFSKLEKELDKKTNRWLELSEWI